MTAPVPIRPSEPFPQMRLDVWRCPKCGTILAKLRLAPGSVIEVKCARCNTLTVREAA